MPKTQQNSRKSAAQHVQRQAKRTGRVTVNQLRIRDLRRLIAHRFAFAVESPLAIALLETLANHLAALPGDPRKRIAALIDSEARWYGIERFDALLDQIKDGLKRWRAAELGWHLRLTEQERAKLKITTIEAAGVSPEQRAEINREKRKQRAADARKAKGAKPRAQWLAEHATKPWTAAGISRRSWYRHRRGTGP